MSKKKQIEFEKSPIKYSEDLNNMLSSQAISVDLSYVDESVKDHNDRLRRVGRKVVASKLKSETIFQFISFVFIIALALSGFISGGDSSGRAFTLIVTLGLMLPAFGLSWLTERLSYDVKINPHYLIIDDTNFDSFTPRILEKGKLHILHNSSFDSNNNLVCWPDKRFEELGYSELIILDNIKRFEETNDGMYITATATVRSNVDNKVGTSYRQSKDNIPLNVYIQRGLYTEEFHQACRRSFFVTDYITKEKQGVVQCPGAIMEISPWDIQPYPELLKSNSPQLDNCQIFYCEDESQPLKYRLSQFYRDDKGEVFYIEYKKAICDNGNLENILDDNLAKELSKTREKRWGKYYADRYMKGYMDWDGKLGDAKVTYLKEPTVKKTSKGWIKIFYTYPNGIKRRLKVPDVFGGLEALGKDI